MPAQDLPVAAVKELAEVTARKAVIIMQGAAAHAIEEHVGEMMDASAGVRALLDGTGAGDASPQREDTCSKVGGDFR